MPLGEAGPSRPVRIELASSESEGGSCQAWVDPVQVLAVLSLSHPVDTFTRVVAPSLAEAQGGGSYSTEGPGRPLPGSAPPVDAAGASAEPAGLPLPMRILVGQLQAMHGALYRENQSRPENQAFCELTCALAEEDRIYFIKGASSWICLLRGGRAYPGTDFVVGEGISPAVLGRSESLRLEVTSMPVLPGDTVVLLTGMARPSPDLRMLERLFSGKADLKRACDGLIGLLGLRSPGASGVALRFTSIDSFAQAEDLGRPLAELLAHDAPKPAEEMDREIETLLARALPPHEAESALIPPTSRTLDPGRRVAAAPAMAPATAPAADPPGTTTATPAVGRILEPPTVLAAAPARPPAESAPAGRTAATRLPAPGVPSPIAQPATAAARGFRARHPLWPFLCGAAGLVLIALLGLPLRGRPGPAMALWGRLSGGGGGSGQTGSLEIAPSPAANRVLIDGEPAAEATPARLDRLPAGKHRLGLDFGPCGVWETEIKIGAGRSLALSPSLTGAVTVSASDSITDGRVWVSGKGKRAVPARLDSLPIGWNRLFFEDSRMAMWDRMVLVKPGRTASVVIPDEPREDQGLLVIEALSANGTEGLVDSRGDSVWVDGRPAGLTPLRRDVAPGLHSVRVRGAGSQGSHTEVLDVRAGSARQVLAELGADPAPVFEHVAPGRVWLHGPVLLSFTLHPTDSGPLGQPTLHLPELSPGVREVPCALVDSTKGTYLGVVRPETLTAGQAVAYYFTAGTAQGETVCSDLYRLLPQAGRPDPRPAAGRDGDGTSGE